MTAHTGRHLALGALCVLLAAALWMEMESGDGSRHPGLIQSPTRPHAAAPSPSPVVALPPLAAFNDIDARPLFWASRRPITGGPAAAPSDIALLGVVVAQNETVALVRHGKPPRVDRVREGSDLEGWKVVEVGLSHILLERGATRAELKRKDPHPTPPSLPAPARPAGGAVPQSRPLSGLWRSLRARPVGLPPRRGSARGPRDSQ